METKGMFLVTFGTKEWRKAIQRMTIVGFWSVFDRFRYIAKNHTFKYQLES